MHSFVYLASQSPRRSQLLEQIGIAHRLLVAQDHDPEPQDPEALEQVLPRESATDYVQRVTGLKLDAAIARLQRRGLEQAPILCSDTTVSLGRHILGKPGSQEQAREMLQALSGKTHRVLTAVALQSGRKRLTSLSVSSVEFAVMDSAQIDAYVASGEPMGKAGAYGVQGRAAAYIARISGSYSGIMGLPVFETANVLRAAGFAI
ncbi:Maf family protein [Comamonas sp. B21-038]|uniref:Maf family protein n=1 Tax=Comamonas sp. B21-038 TaxID=2918299 RepID=UPI001EFB0BFC|nr:Maf family protein [Comamonas sp. B21-038]ULR90872.1 Maf family nucleotide pyrophosphatase [Comamonas sp. B21-038]